MSNELPQAVKPTHKCPCFSIDNILLYGSKIGTDRPLTRRTMQNTFIRSLALMLAVILFCFYGTAGAASDGKKAGKPKYKEGELLVKFKPGVSANKKDTLHRKHGSQKRKEFASLRIHHASLQMLQLSSSAQIPMLNMQNLTMKLWP